MFSIQDDPKKYGPLGQPTSAWMGMAKTESEIPVFGKVAGGVGTPFFDPFRDTVLKGLGINNPFMPKRKPPDMSGYSAVGDTAANPYMQMMQAEGLGNFK